MTCCSHQDFERHPNPEIADIGKGGAAEFTIGRCTNCGAALMHAWVGGVVGSTNVISRELVDSLVAADPEPRKKLLIEWFNSD